MTTAIRPPTAALEAPAATRPRRPAARFASRSVSWAWIRLVGLLLVAVLAELVYVGFWPISYYLTQGPDFSYEYLLEYPAVWERLLPLLVRFEATWPEPPRSLEFMTDTLKWAFVAAFVLYLAAFWLTRAGLPVGWGAVVVVAPALAFQATLFLMPGLFTTDLFSYAMYGQIAGPYGLNPYVHLPAYFPQDRIFHWIHPLWHYAPSVYGPAWIDLSLPIARAIAGWSPIDKVLAYKLLINLVHVLGMGCLALLVHRLRPGMVLPSVVLYAWNPMILFEFAGNGHNDAVMVTLMLVALLLFSGRRPWLRWLGLVALTVALLIKMAAVLLLPYYVIAWARERRTLWGVVQVLAIAGATVLAIAVGLYLPWWVGIETIGPILVWSQGPMYNNYVPDAVAQYLAFEHLLDPTGPDPTAALEQARGWMKLVARPIFAAYCLWELVRVRGGLGLVAAGARVMLAFLLLFNTWVLAWYFTWPLALAVVLGWESTTARVLVGFSLSALTVMYHRHFWHPFASDWTYLPYLAPLAIMPLTRLPRTHRRLGGLSAPRLPLIRLPGLPTRLLRVAHRGRPGPDAGRASAIADADAGRTHPQP